MADFKEVTGKIEVPKNTGMEGFIHTIRELLRKPRLQSINIDSRGQVTFRRFVLEGEEEGPNNNFGVDFAELQPWHVVRNATVQEFLPPKHLAAGATIGLMFDKAAQDQMRPLAFVTGAEPSLWDWYKYTTGHEWSARDQFFGLPLLMDRHVPDTVLLLCTGFGRNAAFIDTQISYKVELPAYAMPTTEVEVMS